MLAILDAAVAPKIAVVAPAATVTDAGTVSKVSLLASVTFDPPAGAILLSVTVQVLTVPWLRLVGPQVRLDSSTGADRSIVAVFRLLPRVAVTIEL